MAIGDLDAVIEIGGTDVSAYLSKVERNASLEKPPQTVDLLFNKSFPWSDFSPWDDLVITEQGTLVFTGYVSHIIPRRQPGAEVMVQGQDTFKRATDWFIDEHYMTSGSSGFTVGHYVDYFCDLCGLSYNIQDPIGEAVVISAEIDLGLRPISEALLQMCDIAQWQMWVDASGVLQFNHIGEPTAPADIILTNVKAFEDETNDIDTRNRVVVWGAATSTGNITYTEERAVTGVTDTRSMLFSAPAIDTEEHAQQLGSAALDQWAKLEHILAVDTLAVPSRYVGQSLQYAHPRLTSGSYLNTLTDMRTEMDLGGYRQSLTSGRRAYRYPAWPTSGSFVEPPTTWHTSGSTGWVQRLNAAGDAVFAIGNITTHGGLTWRVEKIHSTTGSLIWGRSVVEASTTYGTDIIIYNNVVYASVMTYQPFMAWWFSRIVKMEITSGSVIGSVGYVTNFAHRPWMTVRGSTLFVVANSSFRGVKALTLPDLTLIWQGGRSTTAALVAINDRSLITYDWGNGDFLALNTADGTTDLIYHHGLRIAEIAMSTDFSTGNIRLFATSKLSSPAGAWQLSRFDITLDPSNGKVTDIAPYFTVTGPNNYALIGIETSSGPLNRALWVRNILAVVGLNYHYLAKFDDQGTLFYEETTSGSSGDVYTTLYDYGLHASYAAGRKNNAWYVTRLS